MRGCGLQDTMRGCGGQQIMTGYDEQYTDNNEGLWWTVIIRECVKLW